jgi:hypothetical protein
MGSWPGPEGDFLKRSAIAGGGVWAVSAVLSVGSAAMACHPDRPVTIATASLRSLHTRR